MAQLLLGLLFLILGGINNMAEDSVDSWMNKNFAPMTGRKMLETFGVGNEMFANKKILNIGAGGTDFGEELKSDGVGSADVTNIDINYDPTRKSKLWKLVFKLPRSEFPKDAIRADWDSLPFRPQQFDITIMSFSAALWNEKEDFKHTIREATRVTKESILMTGVETGFINHIKEAIKFGEIPFGLTKMKVGYKLERKKDG